MMPEPSRGRVAARRVLLLLAAVLGPAVVALAVLPLVFPTVPPPPSFHADSRGRVANDPRQLVATPRLTLWWDWPAHLGPTIGGRSNVRPADYAGPEACRQCHPGNYEAWSHHPHRSMNALASATTVLGDFSGSASISYRGGQATFERAGDAFVMRLERKGVRRAYRVTQTIGSRFFQYYVGRQTDGPEPLAHHFYHKDHVLPFGYWLGPKEWVPAVHVGPELPDDQRPDPFDPPESGRHYAEYATSCNHCHTTFALGDMFGRRPQQMGEHAPATMHWSVHEYLRTARPSELRTIAASGAATGRDNPMYGWSAEQYAVTFGVSCEACHLGSREHVETAGKERPRFFPTSSCLVVEGHAPDDGRAVENVNWACGRCHTGGRPSFAAGMSTWNSVEFADAARGSCYSKLRCTDCHNPHEALGSTWSKPPTHDDAVCLKCHDSYRAPDRRAAHTHHPPGSTGDRCLNCHMPRINEGLQDVVRTHMIYSPTRPDMIEANHPNACNLCHTDRPIDWTLGHLQAWYGRSYDEGMLARNYPHRADPVARGWLASPNESVRLVAADALARTGDRRVVPDLLAALDDPYLVNRQFAARGLEQWLGVRPADAGYRFFMSREDRARPLAHLRALSAAP